MCIVKKIDDYGKSPENFSKHLNNLSISLPLIYRIGHTKEKMISKCKTHKKADTLSPKSYPSFFCIALRYVLIGQIISIFPQALGKVGRTVGCVGADNLENKLIISLNSSSTSADLAEINRCTNNRVYGSALVQGKS